MSTRSEFPWSSLALAVEVPRWAFGFYFRHLGLIAGLSLVPAAQRFSSLQWGADWPGVVNLVLETVTLGVRVLLVMLIARRALSADDRLNRLSADEKWDRMKAFARAEWLGLLIQCLLFAFALVVFDVLPELAISRWVPDDEQRTAQAILLAVKNPTIIAFTMVWMVGALRQMMLYSPVQGQRLEQRD